MYVISQHHCFINSRTLHFNFTLHANKMRHVVTKLMFTRSPIAGID